MPVRRAVAEQTGSYVCIPRARIVKGPQAAYSLWAHISIVTVIHENDDSYQGQMHRRVKQ
jgi:hypothetical protein